MRFSVLFWCFWFGKHFIPFVELPNWNEVIFKVFFIVLFALKSNFSLSNYSIVLSAKYVHLNLKKAMLSYQACPVMFIKQFKTLITNRQTAIPKPPRAENMSGLRYVLLVNEVHLNFVLLPQSIQHINSQQFLIHTR